MTTAANPYVLLGWGLAAFLFYLNWRGYFKPKRFWFFGPFTSLVYAIVGLIVFMLAISFLANSPKHATFYEQLENARRKNDVIGELNLYNTKDSLNPGKLKWGIPLVDAYIKIPDTRDFWKYQQRRGNFRDKLISQTVLGSDCEKSFALHLLTYWYLKTENLVAAKHFIEQDIKCNSEGFYHLAAKIYYELDDKEAAFTVLLKAIELDNNPEKSFDMAYELWNTDEEKMLLLTNQARAIKYFDFSLLRKYYLNNGNWLKYFFTLYFGILFRYHVFFVLISFLIVASIGYYFYQIDVFNRDSAKRLFSMFILGCALVPLSLFIYDMYGQGWNWFDSFISGTWGYMIFAVGLNEEIIKILVFLVAVYVLKWADEPIDYIIYAAMGALAFAFLENTMYFHRTNGNVVFARTLFSTLGHVFDSSIIAYGLAIFRFKYKNKVPVVILFPILVLIAAIWHGTFNAILSIKLGVVTYFIFIPFAILIMALLGGMVNNAMNNSPHFDKNKVHNNDKGINLIATSFVLLYILQQWINIFLNNDFDSTSANMLNTVALVAVMVIILAYFLGTFDVVRGQWLSPWQMITKKRVNRNVALNVNCKIYTHNLPEIELYSEYLFGKITDRITIKNDHDFFLVSLKTPYIFDGAEYNKVVIRHIQPRHRIRPGIEFAIRFIVPLNEDISLVKSNERSSFEYVGEAFLRCPDELQELDFNSLMSI